MLIEKNIFCLSANLRKSKKLLDTIYFDFLVLADSQFEAEEMLREYLEFPEQTGIKYIECVGIRCESSKLVLVNEIFPGVISLKR